MAIEIQAFRIRRAIILFVLMVSIAYAVPSPFFSSSAGPLVADFTYKPGFVVVGDNVNFTQKVTGGTTPYTSFGWNFGDGSSVITSANFTFHRYASPDTFAVTMNVSDSASGFDSKTYPVTANEWPISSATAYGWVVPWNLTQTDGINIHDVTYHGTIIVRDARLAAVQVLYLNNLCGPFYDEEGQNEMQGVKADGHIYYEQNTTDPANPYFQLRAEYRVSGYDYTEAFRFYKNGAWEPILFIGRDG